MAQKRPKLVQNLHFWSFWAKYCHFLHILSNARPKNNANKVPRWVFRYVSNKTFDFSSKKRIFCPETTKLGPNLAFLTIAGSFGALLVVVARGLYLAVSCVFPKNNCNHIISVLAVFVPEHEVICSVCFWVTAGNICRILLMLVFLLFYCLEF